MKIYHVIRSSQRCSQPEACNFIKKETLTKVFSCEFCEIFKNTFFTEHLRTTASALSAKCGKFSGKASGCFQIKRSVSQFGNNQTISRWGFHSVFPQISKLVFQKSIVDHKYFSILIAVPKIILKSFIKHAW